MTRATPAPYSAPAGALEPVESPCVVAQDEACSLLHLVVRHELRQHLRERPPPPARREEVQLGRPRRIRRVEELRHRRELESLADSLRRLRHVRDREREVEPDVAVDV